MTTISMPVPSKVSRDSSLKVTFAQVAAKFGDGYEQVAPLGINNTTDIWAIEWGGLSSSEYTTVMTALKSVGAWGIITWKPCGELVTKKFRLAGEISQSREGINTYKLTCSLRQVFDIGAIVV